MRRLAETLRGLILAALMGGAGGALGQTATLSSTAPGLEACGADIAAQPEQGVPAWTGGLSSPPAGYRAGDYYPDPFPSDQPLFVVDSANRERYGEWMVPGLQALLERYPDTFRIPVYETRRTHALAPRFYRNCRLNREQARVTDDGLGVLGVVAGTPFPQPRSGLEAVWNHLFRMRGVFTLRQETEAVVNPEGLRTLVRSRQEIAFPMWSDDPAQVQKYDPKRLPLLYYTSYILEPGSMAGGAFMMIDSLNRGEQPRLAWSYDQGQRRLRRVPLADDGPAYLSEGGRTVDDTDLYVGHVANYHWEIKGKRVILAPYNAYRLASNQVRYADLLKPYHLDPAYSRFERRPVWVVEGTLKPGQPHVYQRRVLYLDQDSWGILVAEHYDQQGSLWRVSMANPINFFDVPMTLTVADVFYDLKSGRYNVKGLLNEEGSPGNYHAPLPDPGYFSPGQLRQRVFR